MNDNSVIDDIDTFAARATQLLVEYAAKFATALDRVKRLAARSAADEFLHVKRPQLLKAEVAVVDEWYKRVSPAARKLAQQVSGMIDQGRIAPLEKAELQLRLAEFESSLLTFPQLLNVYRNQDT